jgi:Tol biopolymer transport system component/imidazolonepropionase-like amidohydrolase
MLLLSVATNAQHATAQEDGASRLPLQMARTVSFTTTEGSWMALHVSPDGKQIAFDLLGDIYLLPITGGEATRITSGPEWDVMPRFSPDGRQLAFISDRDGTDNLWVMDLASRKLRQITREVTVNFASPEWTPDGEFIAVRRYEQHPSVIDYRRVISLALYHKLGGVGTELYRGSTTRNKNSGVSFSPDGRYFYFSSNIGVEVGPYLGQYQIIRLDRKTGQTETITSRAGGALRPLISPDGRYLVYATRRDAETALRIRDLVTQQDEWLAGPVQRDNQQGYAVSDVFPGYSFTPDSRAVVFTAGGHIQRVDIQSKSVSLIPFSAHVEQGLATRLHFDGRIEDGPLELKQLQFVNPSPDGKQIVFTALAQLWVSDTLGHARRLTDSNLREYQPVFSPDGRWIAYTTWSDSAGGQLWRVSASGGKPVLLTPMAGFYTAPVWTPDGDRIVFSGGPVQQGFDVREGIRELRWVSFAGGDQHTIAPIEYPPVQVTGRGADARVYFMENTAGVNRETPVNTLIQSIRFDGTDQHLHARYIVTGPPTVAAVPSRNGQWLLLIDRDDLYLMPLTQVGEGPLTVRFSAPSVSFRRVSTDGANYVAWAEDSKSFSWSFTNKFYRASLDAALNTPSSSWNPAPLAINISVPRARPKGKLLLRGARIITAKGDQVIERGDIVIENGRIAAVIEGSNANTPADATVMDVSGKTIIPGLVDQHAHPAVGRELIPAQGWSIASHLAYGVTTARQPSGNQFQYGWAEVIEAGMMVGPRLFGAGQTFTTLAAPIQSQEDAFRLVRQRKLEGSSVIKQYVEPRRIQRQWIAIASAREHIPATNEAGLLNEVVTMAIDGYTGVEHNIEITPLYKDVVELLAQSKVTYTPAMITTYGSPQTYHYWRARTNIHDDVKLRHFLPHDLIDNEMRHVQYFRDEEHHFPDVARAARDIFRAGGNVAMGSHGDQPGIGIQWELWNLASGGFTPLEVIQVATIKGAESMGLTQDIGSIEPGKLGDLLVLDKNPLEDIRNTNTIQYIVKSGFVFDGNTLNQLWPVKKPFPKQYWSADEEQWQATQARLEKERHH